MLVFLAIIFAILIGTFMFTVPGVTEEAKTITWVILGVVFIYVIYRVIAG